MERAIGGEIRVFVQIIEGRVWESDIGGVGRRKK
jgi:hypothetical protein